MNDIDDMYDSIIQNERIFKTGLKSLDILLGGGLHEKSLSLFLADTNLGKTMILCSLASSLINNGYDVLYVTFEDSEKKISKRILQNILDLDQKDLKLLSKENFKKFFAQKTSEIKKKLIIKEYPEYSSNAITIKTLLKNLETKKKFKPQIIIVDYIGCMLTNAKNITMNTNSTLQHVAGETRAIGLLNGMAILSAAQTNRGAGGNSDLELTDAADSYGQNFKADAVISATQPPGCAEADRLVFKLIKTRFDGEMKGERRFVGVNVAKQRVYDIIKEEDMTKSVKFGNNNLNIKNENKKECNWV